MKEWNEVNAKKAREIARQYRADKRIFFMTGSLEENEEYSIFPIRIDDLSMCFDEYEDGGTITTKDAWEYAMRPECVNRATAVTILQHIKDFKKEDIAKGESDIQRLERRLKSDEEKTMVFVVFAYIFIALVHALVQVFSGDYSSSPGVTILLIILLFVYRAHRCTLSKIKAEWQANTVESCQAIIEHLKNGPRIEGGIGIFMKWWVDTQNKRVIPVISVVGIPSFFQKFTNLMPAVFGIHYKYRYRRIKKDNSLGKKVGSGEKFFSYVEAIEYLKAQ